MRYSCLCRQTGMTKLVRPHHGVHTRIGSTVFSAGTGEEDRAVLLRKASEILRTPSSTNEDTASSLTKPYEPTLKREWVRAPVSVLSTAATRRDWFRFMSFNWMVDTVTKFRDVGSDDSEPERTATPVAAVEVRMPSFAREGARLSSSSSDAPQPPAASAAAASEADSSGTSAVEPSPWVTYDPKIDDSPPPFLQFPFRRAYLLNEVRHYDPDVLCLNEVNRAHFRDGLWKYLRFQGYGCVFTSSRGYGVRAAKRSDDPVACRRAGRIAEMEDIGNVIYFHKSRFVPLMMPGGELPNFLHYCQFCTLKDKISGMTLVVANLQLTAGETEEAVAIRAHEAKMIVTVLSHVDRHIHDRSHCSVVVCGDWNCTSDEEPCVQVFRDRFFSAYDLVGGPRWTTYYKSSNNMEPNAYYANNRAGWTSTNTKVQRETEIEVAIARRAADREFAASRARSAAKSEAKVSAGPLTTPSCEGAAAAASLDSHKTGKGDRSSTACITSEEAAPGPASTAEKDDVVQVEKRLQLSRGIVKRTQDFLFYDPNGIALHQLLDTPDDKEIDPVQMLPSSKHPSHHIPLVMDISFHDVSPDLDRKSSKP